MSDELLWAVTDGPAGTAPVALPEEGAAADALRRHHDGAFWCSRQAGGCGGLLVLEVRNGARPQFRHRDHAPCTFTGRQCDAGRAYEHLRYQRAVEAWLVGQGHRPRLRKTPGPDGRTGLYAVVDEISHAIVVQLAPLPDTAWRERDDHHRRRVRQVTWLYGPAAEAIGDTEVAVRGVAYSVRRHGVHLLVGVRGPDDRTRWVRLGACRLTAGGFEAPGTEEARALHASRAAERREAARRAARCATGGARAGLRAGRAPSPLPFPQ